MDERARRLAENEAQFRDVNERIERAAARFGGEQHVYEFVCECSHADCLERVHLTVERYQAVRRHRHASCSSGGTTSPRSKT